VRVRATALAVVVVAVALLAAGIGLVLLVQRSLHDRLVADATAQADAAAALAMQGELHSQLPVRAGVAVQVVDASGRVLSASADLAGRDALSEIRPAVGTHEILRTTPVFPGDDQPDLTVATTVRTPQGPVTVYAATSTEPSENSTHLLALALAVVLPLLVALVGGLEWVLAGRALRPVEAIRAEVADITAGDLHRRVPEPPIDDEIGRLARTMNAMLSRLEASADRQRQFVSDASHELRSPLAALLAQIEVARAHPDSADWSAVAGAVSEEGARIWRVIDDLLLLARSDEGHLVPGRDAVDLDELVLADALRIRGNGHVEVDLTGVGAGRVAGDREQLRRVVRNLADNAERHADKTVAFSVQESRGWVELVVADDGPGIPPDQRERVFERFARLDTSRNRAAGGTGLGLAIVGEVVTAHGGTVAVADSPGGARMVVRLPAYAGS
jgi:signal transduction histidine kinase